jgi:hypothetical protein
MPEQQPAAFIIARLLGPIEQLLALLS